MSISGASDPRICAPTIYDDFSENPAEQRHRESQILQSQKLEAIGHLAAGIAHEINTPMQFVKDNIEYLSESLDKLFTLLSVYDQNLTGGPQKPWPVRLAEIQEQLARAGYEKIRQEIPHAIVESLEGIHRVIDIVKAMKDFAHPGHDEKEEVDLNSVVQSCVTITRNRWKSAADMQLNLDPYLPIIQCVSAEISQVLLNLIVNAADAISDQTTSGSDLGTITIRTLFQPGIVTLEVSDTGCGISEEIKARIFDPFFTTKEVGRGTGQGLTICYNIVVQRLGGSIAVESAVGRGTKFVVQLPTKAAIRGDDAPSDNDSSHATGIPIFAD